MAVQFRLRELLERRGLTQTELQLRTGLAYSTVNDLFNNKPRRVELDTLDVLCDVLDCDVGDLLEYIRDKKRGRA
jgi:putative transcriptional regulator